MSLRAMVWALHDAPAKSAQEHVILWALADRANEFGEASFAYVPTLAARGRCSERTVQRCLREMTARGLIRLGDQQLVAHYRPDKRPVVYDLDMTKIVSRDIAEQADSMDAAPESAQVERGDNLSPRDEFGATGQVDDGKPQVDRGDIMLSPRQFHGVTNGAHGVTNRARGDSEGSSGVTQLCHPYSPLTVKEGVVTSGGERHLSDTPAPETTPPDLEFDRDLPEPPPDIDDPEPPADPGDPQPSRYCARHPRGTFDSCRACGEARHLHSQWTARHAQAIAEATFARTRAGMHARAQAAEAKALAVACCNRCDADGFLLEPGDGKIELCTHQDPSAGRETLRALYAAEKARKAAK